MAQREADGTVFRHLLRYDHAIASAASCTWASPALWPTVEERYSTKIWASHNTEYTLFCVPTHCAVMLLRDEPALHSAWHLPSYVPGGSDSPLVL
jgi:hypothetical protein